MTNQERDRRIGAVLLYQVRELRMCWDFRQQPPKWDFPARLREEESNLAYGYRQRPTGGTGMQALAQLVRFVRDLPRLPISTFEYWASDTIKLATPNTIEILKAGGYDDPAKTCCVLCGDRTWKRGLDWWSLDGVVGPCCRFGCCQRLEDGHRYVPISREQNFCGHYDEKYGHCGHKAEEHVAQGKVAA